MSAGLLLQHAIAIVAALAALGWLIARARSPKKRGSGPCASCGAATAAANRRDYLRTAKRPEAAPSRVVILKK